MTIIKFSAEASVIGIRMFLTGIEKNQRANEASSGEPIKKKELIKATVQLILIINAGFMNFISYGFNEFNVCCLWDF